MKVDVVMPQMGESITEGTIIKWHKKKGEMVKRDETIYEISTDKVDTEIPSPEDGILIDIKVFEQETVSVGTVVAILETNGEAAIIQTEEKKIETHSTTQVGGELVDIPMPKMGESVIEGTIVKWHKKVGDKVNADEIILEISTDKVDTEVPSPVDGVLSEILYKENDTIAVGIPIARISTLGGIAKTKVVEKESVKVREKEIEIISNKQETVGKGDKNKFFSPLVLNIARAEGISINELENIQGTGINGRVTKKDILEFIRQGKAGSVSSPQIETAGQTPNSLKSEEIKSKADQRVEIIPMDISRQRIMDHMIDSRNTSVHVTQINEVDMTKIHNLIEKKRNVFAEEGIKLTYMPFISYAVVKALKAFPLMNASIEGKNIIEKKYINLGIAVAVEPNGLIVPNIKNADEKNIRGLAKSIVDLGYRARNKKLVPEDVVDGTFSITNYGVFGSLFGTPIINQPEVGILGVGAVAKKPVIVENNGVESIAIKPMMYLSLSHDHRLVDGMIGGKFIMSIKNTLENFDVSIV